MILEQALQTKLKDVAGHARVYPDAVPDEQNVWPCIVYTHAGDDEQFGLNGVEATDHRDVYGLEIWGKDRVAVIALRDLLKAAFRGVNAQGIWGGTGGVVVAGAYAREATGDVAPSDDGSDRHDRCERLSLTVIWYGSL